MKIADRMRMVFLLLGTFYGSSLFGGPLYFAGPYAPGNWTLVTNGGNGFVDISGAPAFVTLWGSDTGEIESGVTTLYSITIPSTVSLDFYWSYFTFDDGPWYDPAGYAINGVQVQLTNDEGSNSQSGFISGLNLTAGDTFAFYVWATDDCCGAAQLTISGEPLGGEIPEPGTLVLMGAGLVLVAVWRSRSQEAPRGSPQS